MLQYVVFIGATLQFFGGVAYVKDTLQGKAKPNRVTWFLWAAAPLIATAAALSDGVRWAVLPAFMAGLMPLLVLISSFVNKNAYWKLGFFDYTCGIFSALALILWYITQEPVVAIIFAILADGLAALPTIIKTWSFPETESPWIYAATIVSAFLSFVTIRSWNFSEYGFSSYLIVICLVVLFAMHRKKLNSFFIQK